jgi:soluble lytic murein transglycosylase-like protein
MEETGLGIRYTGAERRALDRRGCDRGTRDRRRSERRKNSARSLLFTALALVAPQALKSTAGPFFSNPRLTLPDARVTTTIRSFDALVPEHGYDDIIKEAAERYQVSPTLIRSVIMAESAFDPAAVSPVGAMGLMQLMPEIAKAYGVENPYDPRENIMAGTLILKELLNLYRGDLPLTIASYNAGAGVVAQYGGIPPFRETQDYVKRVTRLISEVHS